MTPAEHVDANYLGFVLRIFRTNVVIYTPDGFLLANLGSVPTARAFCREQRRIDRAFSTNFAALEEAAVQTPQVHVAAAAASSSATVLSPDPPPTPEGGQPAGANGEPGTHGWSGRVALAPSPDSERDSA